MKLEEKLHAQDWLLSPNSNDTAGLEKSAFRKALIDGLTKQSLLQQQESDIILAEFSKEAKDIMDGKYPCMGR